MMREHLHTLPLPSFPSKVLSQLTDTPAVWSRIAAAPYDFWGFFRFLRVVWFIISLGFFTYSLHAVICLIKVLETIMKQTQSNPYKSMHSYKFLILTVVITYCIMRI